MLCVAFATGAIAAAAQPAPDPHALLAETERTLVPAQSHWADLKITEYKNRQVERAMTLRAFVRAPSGRGAPDSLSVILDPPMYRYRLLLHRGGEFWLFQPGAKQPFRLAPEHRLLGQVALADLMTAPRASDPAALLGAETITGGDKTPHQAWHVRVTPGGESKASFAQADLWIDQSDRLPVMARTFALGGRLLKTAFYTRYREILGAQRPSRTLLVDGLNPEMIACIDATAWSPGDWPPAWFEPDNLRSTLASLPLPAQKP